MNSRIESLVLLHPSLLNCTFIYHSPARGLSSGSSTGSNSIFLWEASIQMISYNDDQISSGINRTIVSTNILGEKMLLL